MFESSSISPRCRLTPSWCLKCTARVGGTITPGLSELQKQRDACSLPCVLPLFLVDVCFGVLIEFASCLRPMWQRRKGRNCDLMFLPVMLAMIRSRVTCYAVNQPDIQNIWTSALLNHRLHMQFLHLYCRWGASKLGGRGGCETCEKIPTQIHGFLQYEWKWAQNRAISKSVEIWHSV